MSMSMIASVSVTIGGYLCYDTCGDAVRGVIITYEELLRAVCNNENSFPPQGQRGKKGNAL